MAKDYTLTLVEQETIIGRSADENFWDVYSCLPSEIKQFKRYAALWGIELKILADGSIRGKFPLEFLTFNKPISDKQVKHLKKSRNKINYNSNKNNTLQE